MNQRWAVTVSGQVQGVGFRPYIQRLATSLNLAGFVRNIQSGVIIEIEGPEACLSRFVEGVPESLPKLAHIDQLSVDNCSPLYSSHFEILPSTLEDPRSIMFSPDVGICDDCLGEWQDPDDRRFHYPFISCTQCGPRWTMIEGSPYDRCRSSMRSFPLCELCLKEFHDPESRWFHSHGMSCPDCGPQLSFYSHDLPLDGASSDPIEDFVQLLEERRIGALKGIGGYHLMCDATNASAVSVLRDRKKRNHKPFAVMVSDLTEARQLCFVSEDEEKLLTCAGRPIVLMKKRSTTSIAPNVAPGQDRLGVMLPYTALHHSLFLDARRVLVVTSANPFGGPMIFKSGPGHKALFALAGGILDHNRDILTAVDDSVFSVSGDKALSIRRSRGYSPKLLRLPGTSSRNLLAVGADLKASFALSRGGEAILSQYLGDLHNFDSLCAFEESLKRFQGMHEWRPDCLVHDLHPAYESTRFALESGLPCLGVQHHHAHMASCMAEHRLSGDLLGVVFDGLGYGLDGTLWGGEFFVGGYEKVRRGAYLRPVPLPGNDKANREPWRMALSYLYDAGIDEGMLLSRIPEESRRLVRSMIERELLSPKSSSAGRLWDAVAAFLGLCDVQEYEGQAAQLLESLAGSRGPGEDHDPAYPFDMDLPEASWQIDTRPMIRAIVRDLEQEVSPVTIARRFHDSMAEMIVRVLDRLRGRFSLRRVILSGGSFQNLRLLETVLVRLNQEAFQSYFHEALPANDGGISFGQLAIAIARLKNDN